MVSGNSMFAPMSLSLKAKSAAMNNVWRVQGSIIILIICAIFQKTFRFIEYDPFLFLYNNIKLFMISGFFSSIWMMCYIIGASMTVTSHAVLLYTSLSVYLISYNLITCQFVHNLSKAGLVFVILGI